jgi:hypothetical protein
VVVCGIRVAIFQLRNGQKQPDTMTVDVHPTINRGLTTSQPAPAEEGDVIVWSDEEGESQIQKQEQPKQESEEPQQQTEQLQQQNGTSDAFKTPLPVQKRAKRNQPQVQQQQQSSQEISDPPAKKRKAGRPSTAPIPM